MASEYLLENQISLIKLKAIISTQLIWFTAVRQESEWNQLL